ncbi:hypothetical protein EDC01DRAFT_150114 [Geopyxis carbonaria]|nr:hypothetical protein EDC01DRAFT_150114 [Geopyxis carbonaria]
MDRQRPSTSRIYTRRCDTDKGAKLTEKHDSEPSQTVTKKKQVDSKDPKTLSSIFNNRDSKLLKNISFGISDRIPPHILAVTGSSWDEASGRRQSRRNTITFGAISGKKTSTVEYDQQTSPPRSKQLPVHARISGVQRSCKERNNPSVCKDEVPGHSSIETDVPATIEATSTIKSNYTTKIKPSSNELIKSTNGSIIVTKGANEKDPYQFSDEE